MRILVYSVVIVVILCIGVPMVQAMTESDVTVGCPERILAITDAENRFYADYGVHSSEYRNLATMDSSSDLVVLDYIDKDYLVCTDSITLYRWEQLGQDAALVCSYHTN